MCGKIGTCGTSFETRTLALAPQDEALSAMDCNTLQIAN